MAQIWLFRTICLQSSIKMDKQSSFAKCFLSRGGSVIISATLHMYAKHTPFLSQYPGFGKVDKHDCRTTWYHVWKHRLSFHPDRLNVVNEDKITGNLFLVKPPSVVLMRNAHRGKDSGQWISWADNRDWVKIITGFSHNPSITFTILSWSVFMCRFSKRHLNSAKIVQNSLVYKQLSIRYCLSVKQIIELLSKFGSFRSMMTSSNGNIFHVTGHLCGEFTGHRWIPRTKDSDAELWCFFDLRLNKRLSKQSRCWWFETPSCPIWRHRNAKLSFPLAVVAEAIWSACNAVRAFRTFDCL